MTCPACAPMCATTQEQLATRMRNMAEVPDASVHPCGTCGGVDWATTREMIKPPPVLPWWRRWGSPSLRQLLVLHVIAGVTCVGIAAGTAYGGETAYDRWVTLVDAFFGGFNLAQALSATIQMRMRRAVDEMSEAFNQMAELNKSLLRGEVEMHIMKLGRHQDDDTPPIAPTKLH